MSDEAPTDPAYLPLRVLDRIDQVCDRFEAAWEAGNRPRLEDFLDEIDDAHRFVFLRDLLAAEIAARRRRGEHPTPEEYAALCPEGAGSILDLFVTTSSSRGDRPGPPRGVESDPPDRLGDYRIERLIGRGGMGVVYRAFDERRGTSVALKTMRRAEPATFLRFKREFRALTDIAHPNLVTLHELQRGRGRPLVLHDGARGRGLDFLTFVRSGAESCAPEPLDWTTSARPLLARGSSLRRLLILVDDSGHAGTSTVPVRPASSPSDRVRAFDDRSSPDAGDYRTPAFGRGGNWPKAVAFFHDAGHAPSRPQSPRTSS